MERSILRELNKSNVTAYINRARETYLKRMFYQAFFPLRYTTQLTWQSLSGTGGNPVMADVIEYNASAEEKSRTPVQKASGDIPKIAIKRKMDEKDYNDYITLRALANDSNKQALLDLVFNDLDFTFQGVHARSEYLAMQALSYGEIVLTDANNNGMVTKVNVDFQIPSGNKDGATAAWSNASSAKPITDIQAVVDAARANGHSLMYMIMDLTTFNYMKATTEVKEAWQGLNLAPSAKRIPNLDDINAYLQAERLPQIIIVDSQVRFEDKNNDLSSLSPWKTGYVAFVPSLRVGQFMHGPIAKENSEAYRKKAIMVKRDHVLISKWSTEDPFAEWTEGQANAFPVFTDSDSIYLLKSNGTSWS